MFSLQIRGDVTHIAQAADLRRRLAQRTIVPPDMFQESLAKRELYYNSKGYENAMPPDGELFEGTFYLSKNDEYGRRSYRRVPHVSQKVTRVARTERADQLEPMAASNRF